MSEIDVIAIVRGQVEERLEAADEYVKLGRVDQAAQLSVVLGSPDHLAPDRRYLLRWLVVDPGEGGMTAQREGTARNTVARFRAEYARHAGEQEYEEFVAQIREQSAQVREWWDEHEVIEAQRGTKLMERPQLGTLRLHHAQTVPTAQPELRMAVYAPADEATRPPLATL